MAFLEEPGVALRAGSGSPGKLCIRLVQRSEPVVARMAGRETSLSLGASWYGKLRPARRSAHPPIGAWTIRYDAACIERMLEDADIPATRVYKIADCAADPQLRARGMVREVAYPTLGVVLHPGIVPAVTNDPGGVCWPGPPIGAHNEEVLGHLLGLSAGERAQLEGNGLC